MKPIYAAVCIFMLLINLGWAAVQREEPVVTAELSFLSLHRTAGEIVIYGSDKELSSTVWPRQESESIRYTGGESPMVFLRKPGEEIVLLTTLSLPKGKGSYLVVIQDENPEQLDFYALPTDGDSDDKGVVRAISLVDGTLKLVAEGQETICNDNGVTVIKLPKISTPSPHSVRVFHEEQAIYTKRKILGPDARLNLVIVKSSSSIPTVVEFIDSQ